MKKGESYQKLLERTGIPSLAFRCIREDLIQIFKLFSISDENVIRRRLRCLRGHDRLLLKQHINARLSKQFLLNKRLSLWNALPRDMVHSSTLSEFKYKLEKFFGVRRYMLDPLERMWPGSSGMSTNMSACTNTSFISDCN